LFGLANQYSYVNLCLLRCPILFVSKLLIYVSNFTEYVLSHCPTTNFGGNVILLCGYMLNVFILLFTFDTRPVCLTALWPFCILLNVFFNDRTFANLSTCLKFKVFDFIYYVKQT
jgi:hypothetical protein